MNPIKILELKGDDWMKGLSAHAGLPVGGIFQTATNFDPFSLPGYIRGSILPTDVDTSTLSTQINSMSVGSSAGVGYVMAVGNRASGGAKCVYRIRTSDNVVTDFQASVGSALLLNGSVVYGDYFIYADGNNGVIRSATFPGITGDTFIEVPGSTNWTATNQPCVFRVGPSGYLHFLTNVANGKVGVIAVPGSNSGNNTDDSVVVQSNLTPNDMVSDGRYLVVIADDNPSKATGVTSDCKVFFTVPAFSAGAPVSTTTWDVAYQIPDQYLIAIRHIAGRTYVIGYSGIWEVGIGMAPQLVMPLTPSQLPTNPYDVTVQKNIMYWSAHSTGSPVFGFGHLFGGRPVLFQPYVSTQSTQVHTALVSSGDYFYAGLDGTSGGTIKVVAHNWGTTRGSATIGTIAQHLSQPYALSRVKVNLKRPLTTGESVTMGLYNANDEVILDNPSKTFAGQGALRTLLFEPTAGIANFENFYLQGSASDGAIIDTVQVWATPQTPLSQRK